MPPAAQIRKNTPLPFYIPASGTPAFTWDQKDMQKALANKTQAPASRQITQTAKESLPVAQIKKPKRTPSPLPPHLAYPPTWRDLRTTGFSLADAGAAQIAAAAPGKRTFISFIAFTVDGPTAITIGFGTMGSSGPMMFGDTDQPMGAIMNFGESPAPCGLGGAAIFSDGSGTSIAGFAVYYQERDESPI